jgi:hypothetical protein
VLRAIREVAYHDPLSGPDDGVDPADQIWREMRREAELECRKVRRAEGGGPRQ